jgi:hypothetical protein
MVLTVVTTAGVIVMMNLQRRDAKRLSDLKGSPDTALESARGSS